jgi:hypothetical protein
MPTGYELVHNPTQPDLVLAAVPEPGTHHGGQALVCRSACVCDLARHAAQALRPQNSQRLAVPLLNEEGSLTDIVVTIAYVTHV